MLFGRSGVGISSNPNVLSEAYSRNAWICRIYMFSHINHIIRMIKDTSAFWNLLAMACGWDRPSPPLVLRIVYVRLII